MPFIALIFFGVLLYALVVAVAHLWPLWLALAGGALAVNLARRAKVVHDAARAEVADEHARLIYSADLQHQKVLNGDLDGIYGNFPPPKETRGLGIWLTDKK